MPTHGRRRRPRRVALFVFAFCVLGQFGCDWSRGGERLQRWLAWTGPISRPALSCASQARFPGLRSFARHTLANQPYPYSLDWLLAELTQDSPELCELQEGDWVRFGLTKRDVQSRVLNAALSGPVEPGTFRSSFLAQFTRRFEADAWVWSEIQRAAKNDCTLMEFLPYRLGTESDWMGSEAFRSAVADVQRGSEPAMVLDRLGQTDQALLLDLLSQQYPEELDGVFCQRSGRSKAIAGLLMLARGEKLPRLWLTKIADDELPTLTSYHLDERLLRILAEKLPATRFARGCSDYEAIRGGHYFGDDSPRGYGRLSADLRHRLLVGAPREEERWRLWLQHYPGHPGADDATYWLTRTLEWQGKRRQAFTLVVRQLANPVGDGGAAQSNFRARFLWMLDVGLTPGEMGRFLKDEPESPAAPLVRYALAVRAARVHCYRKALNLSRGLTLEASYRRILGETWTPFCQRDELQSLDLSLRFQRSHWKELTGSRKVDLAERWMDVHEGWQLGYLCLYAGHRYDAMVEANTFADSLALEPTGRPDSDLLRSQCQEANHYVVALRLLQSLPEQQRLLAAQVRLLRLIRAESSEYEARALIPLPGLPDGPRDHWYAEQADNLTRMLEQRFPGSDLCDDALMDCYQMSGDKSYLREILLFYPNSNQARMIPMEDSLVRDRS